MQVFLVYDMISWSVSVIFIRLIVQEIVVFVFFRLLTLSSKAHIKVLPYLILLAVTMSLKHLSGCACIVHHAVPFQRFRHWS